MTSKAITIEWQAPRNDGGAPIRGYTLERRQGHSNRFLTVGRGLMLDTWYRDNSVYDGTEYEYRVSAENEAGQSAPCQPVGPIMVKEPFGKYTLFCLPVSVIINISAIIKYY